MTIGIGILTNHGIVVAADTLETWGIGSTKTNVAKILTGGTVGKAGSGCIAVSGAGDAGYLDCLKQEIVNLFLDYCRAGTVPTAFEPALKNLIRHFHVQHVIPFAKYPDSLRPQIDLLVAISHSNISSLWVTNRTTTTKALPYGLIGVGANHAKALIDRLTIPWTDIKLAKIVAAYVIFSTRATVEGCGGNTHVATVAGDIAAYVSRDLILEMEKLFSSYEGIEARMFYHSIGYSPQSSTKDFRKVSVWLKALRKDFISLTAKL